MKKVRAERREKKRERVRARRPSLAGHFTRIRPKPYGSRTLRVKAKS